MDTTKLTPAQIQALRFTDEKAWANHHLREARGKIVPISFDFSLGGCCTRIMEIAATEAGVTMIEHGPNCSCSVCSYAHPPKPFTPEEIQRINENMNKSYSHSVVTFTPGPARMVSLLEPEQEEPEPPKYPISNPINSMLNGKSPDAK